MLESLLTKVGQPLAARLPPRPGEWIDRGRAIALEFEGQRLGAFEGDTISSAMWGAGFRVLSRSAKHRRPRGIYSLTNHDAGSLVLDASGRLLRGDVTRVIDGMQLRGVNLDATRDGELGRFLAAAQPHLATGWIYKHLHRPRELLPFYELQLRRLVGLKPLDATRRPRPTPKCSEACDVLIVGAGAAGLAAAETAARGLPGRRVVLVDENPHCGGSLTLLGDDPIEMAALVAAVRDLGVELRLGTQAAALYADRLMALVDDHKLTKMRCGHVILATGVMEQPAVFAGNDTPGVMLASAGLRLIHRFGIKPCERAVLLAGNDSAYAVAHALLDCGVDLACVADLRPRATAEGESVAHRGVRVLNGFGVISASAGSDAALARVSIAPIDDVGHADVAHAEAISADGLMVSVGYQPADSLLLQAGGTVRYDDRLGQFVAAREPDGVTVCGKVRGVFGSGEELEDGHAAGEFAVARVAGARVVGVNRRPPIASRAISHAYPVSAHNATDAMIDLDEDTSLADLHTGFADGFVNHDMLKRYTKFGTGITQGKLANLNAIRVLARLRGDGVGDVGLATQRPFWQPVALEKLAGRNFHPHRQTTLHRWHQQANATFLSAGDWLRPAFYARGDEPRETCIEAETLAVRHDVGLVDVGTLGKLAVLGPDAAAFLERMYTGRFSNMKVGSTRYGILLDETGVLIDDGVIARLADEQFYVTTTTTGSGNVYREMQRWALIWQMQVTLANQTSTYGAMNLAGPRAADVLRRVCDVDLAAFGYLGARHGKVAGVDALLMRVGFVGELGYEIHVASSSAPHVWQTLIDAGEPFGIRPFGIEAQRLLRLEKAHIIVGQDTDGLTLPHEAHCAWACKMDKPFFVGQRSLQIQLARGIKRALVGFEMSRDAPTRPQENHLVIHHGEIVGRVTSVAYSATLGKVIGLAFVPPELSAVGTQIRIKAQGQLVAARVCATPFYDPTAERQALAAGKDVEPFTRAVPPAGEQLEVASRTVAVRDLSALPKVTLKGPAAAEALRRVGLTPPEQYYIPNQAENGRITRVGASEYFIWDTSAAGPSVSGLARSAASPGAYVISRAELCVQLSGSAGAVWPVLQQLVTVDPGQVNGRLLYLLVAGVAGAIWIETADSENMTATIWFDVAHRTFMTHVLSDVIE